MKDASYWISISHLSGWKIMQINELIIQIYHKDRIDLAEFFALDSADWINHFQIDEVRIPALLDAKAELANNAFLAESLYNQGFELIPVNSPEYSVILKDNLKLGYSPPLLYIKGNKQLLTEDSIAIVGSRNASEPGLQFTENVAKKASADYRVIVSGFAKGIDKAALDCALKYKGHSIIVLPQGVMTFGNGYKTYYKPLIDGDLLVLSTFHPKAPWQVSLAMARNVVIYGLAKEIYVADSANSGGTWSGVKDGLRKGRTIYVRRAEATENSANNLLIEMGAKAVDINGESENTNTADSDENKQSGLSDRILDLLSQASFSALELCKKLETDISPKSLTELLSTMTELEKFKTGKSVKYRIRQQEIFDFD